MRVPAVLQEDITRGRGMVDSLFQGFGQGTQNAVLSSEEYLSNAQRTMDNIEDGFYISPAFLDKLSIHVAKNFLELPKIKVPLILGIWGGKGQGKTFQVTADPRAIPSYRIHCVHGVLLSDAFCCESDKCIVVPLEMHM